MKGTFLAMMFLYNIVVLYRVQTLLTGGAVVVYTITQPNTIINIYIYIYIYRIYRGWTLLTGGACCPGA